MKRCTKCEENKNLLWFRKKSDNKDGLANQCKTCRKKLDAIYRATDRGKESKKKGDSNYRKTDKCKATQRRYAITEKGKACSKRNDLREKLVNGHKIEARQLLRNGMRRGVVLKLNLCELCGHNGLKIHGHHWDYSKPLDVVWCCSQCHTDIHRNKEIYILKRQNDVILHHIISGELA